ncbi:MAG: TonB-dependent receptor, partial [Gammaproteobacteria bacterium]
EEAREYNNQFYTAVVSTNTLGFINDPAAPPLTGLELGSLLDYDHESETSALFGQTTYLVGERLSLTGGLRYTRDDKRLTQRSPQPPAPRIVDTDSSELNWMANALYLWSEDVSTYLRVSTGYKAGGSNARSVNPSFEPEHITSYELGLKSTWLERRLQLNLAAFYSQYRDLQVQQFEAGSGGATSITVNAGRARYLGLEVELQAYLTNALSVSANLGLLDPKYEEFLYVDPACDPATEPDGDCRIDIADQAEFPYTSKLTADVGLQYALPSLAFGTPLLRVDYSYRSELYYHPFTALAEDIKAPGQGLLGARLALSEIVLGGLALEAAIWGRNLLDEDYVASGIDFGGLQYGIRNYGPPRTVGLDLKIEYR